MEKQRTAIPKNVREDVLKEFNHRCAVCAGDRPQLHHIDENPANHDLLNLLPLCPNCHLSDEHNPTAGLGAGRLSLFRRFKDPAILAPQFLALFNRLRFFDSIEINEQPVEDLEASTTELVELIHALEMGSFYGNRVLALLKRPLHGYVIRLGGGPDPEYERARKRHNMDYRKQVSEAKNSTIELVIEQLRFQTWSAGGKIDKPGT